MSSPDRSDLFDDPVTEIHRLEAQIEEMKNEARTATPERRGEIDWWIVGARRHIGRLMDANLARRFGEHRFIIHEMEGGRIWALCSCGARIPGRVHKDFTLAEFPHLAGHAPTR